MNPMAEPTASTTAPVTTPTYDELFQQRMQDAYANQNAEDEDAAQLATDESRLATLRAEGQPPLDIAATEARTQDPAIAVAAVQAAEDAAVAKQVSAKKEHLISALSQKQAAANDAQKQSALSGASPMDEDVDMRQIDPAATQVGYGDQSYDTAGAFIDFLASKK